MQATRARFAHEVELDWGVRMKLHSRLLRLAVYIRPNVPTESTNVVEAFAQFGFNYLVPFFMEHAGVKADDMRVAYFTKFHMYVTLENTRNNKLAACLAVELTRVGWSANVHMECVHKEERRKKVFSR
jgi:hypothetical protein